MTAKDLRQIARLAIFVGKRGRGSNMRAISKACEDRKIDGKVALVVSQSPNSEAVALAHDLGLNVAVIDSQINDYGEALVACLEENATEIICLAGYMRLLPDAVVNAFPGRILNVHPALLPKFGGKGMFGIHVHKAVIQSGEIISGCTVHVVTERYDEGQIILQKECPVSKSDTPESLATKVGVLEYETYPEAIQMLWKKIRA